MSGSVNEVLRSAHTDESTRVASVPLELHARLNQHTNSVCPTHRACPLQQSTAAATLFHCAVLPQNPSPPQPTRSVQAQATRRTRTRLLACMSCAHRPLFARVSPTPKSSRDCASFSID